MSLPIRLAVAVVTALACAGTANAALKPGTQAPDFQAPAYLAGKPFTFKLSEALTRGPVVVYFFPAAFTPGCNIEAHLFSQAVDQFKASGATVIGVTAGNTEQLAEFSKDTKTCGGKFAVAADPKARIAGEFDTRMDSKPEMSARTSYVIDATGKVVHAYTNPNPNDHVKQSLDAVRGLDKQRPASTAADQAHAH